MSKLFRLSIYILSIFLWLQQPKAQYFSEPLDKSVKSLQIFKEGWNLSYPVINLNSDEQIKIEFDILTEENIQCYYKVYHCNANWEKSEIRINEYMRGMPLNEIPFSDYSYNTNLNYIHYSLSLPNKEVALLISGNYRVEIYNSNVNGELIATANFYITDNTLNISAECSGNTEKGTFTQYQQLNINADISKLPVTDVYSEIYPRIIQNNSLINMIEGVSPTYINPNNLEYNQNKELTIPAGKEYYTFDFSSVKYNGPGIYNIEMIPPIYHILLYESEESKITEYKYFRESNGRFLIRRVESGDEFSSIESDYNLVYFTLREENPRLDGKVYVDGGFTYNCFDERNEMHYNFETKCYELEMLLKQGHYDFRYIFVPNFTKVPELYNPQANYYQTENEYLILFYYRENMSRYDKLAGIQIVNSVK